MTDQHAPRVCPQCAQSDMTRPVSAIVRDEPGSPLATKLAPPRSPGAATTLGCATLFFAAMIGISAAMLATALADVTSTAPRGSLPLGLRDVSVFTGIVTFLFVFVGVYAVFVWRQARADAQLRKAIVAWHRASERWQQLYHCARCDGVFIPGQPSLTPVDQALMMLYTNEPSQRRVTSVDATPS